MIEREPSFQKLAREILEQKTERGIEEKLEEETKKRIKLTKKLKEDIKGEITFEQEKEINAIVEKWCREHRSDVKNMGYDIKRIEDMRTAFLRLGGVKEMFSEKGKREYKEKITNLCVLNGLAKKLEKKEPLEVNEARLLLYQLNKRANKEVLQNEIKKENPEMPEEKVRRKVNKKLKDLFKIRKELAKGITGKDLEKEAIKKNKEFAEFPELPGKLKEAMKEKKQEKSKDQKDQDKIKRLTDEIKKLREEIKKKQESLDNYIEEELKEIAQPIERAKKRKKILSSQRGVEVVCGAIRDKMAKEEAIKEIKEKKRKELENIEKVFKQEGISFDLEGFFRIASRAEDDENLKKLTGDEKKDFEPIRDFLVKMRIDIANEEWNNFLANRKKQHIPYNKEMLKGWSFLNFLIDLFSFLASETK
jgi:hypothetical protein